MEGHPCINCRNPTDSAILTLRCNHVFHLNCYMLYFEGIADYTRNLYNQYCPMCDTSIFSDTFLELLEELYPRNYNSIEQHPAVLYQTDETFQKDLLDFLKIEKKYFKLYGLIRKSISQLNKKFQESIHMSLQYIRAEKKFFLSQIKNIDVYQDFIKTRNQFSRKYKYMKKSYGSLHYLYELNRLQGIKGVPRIPIRFRRRYGYYRNVSVRHMFWRYTRIRI